MGKLKIAFTFLAFIACFGVAIMLAKISTRQKSPQPPPPSNEVRKIQHESQKIRDKEYSNDAIVDSLNSYLPDGRPKRTNGAATIKRGERIPGL